MPGQYVYTHHARLRMVQRSIAETDVEYVVQCADEVRQDTAGHTIYRANCHGRRIGVVLQTTGSPYRVITAYVVP